ncbi:MAG: Cys-tRNA(Pro) deacylase [Propionicimonas sp.]|uniref:Cys-tRNA(Pro) deacylase n=1 Tax=Propionicimonas sp. TaxID=1955623 RepID=UPI002B217097|nr:Cys-tRNA(Pro) deacylase [Propionicimonas sp.]MEA4943083.1 Cys-tRNA(Pro) deacylase [Propionicimonas sp.]MEA5052695.1 Cys-tRNA(Pro) deacylase [Propionicimonas sp.]MEA5117834.1 Cys-tRNA(Pro) deacylase [Propionicimonas sp.]
MSATPATAALDAAGVAYTVHPYAHDPGNRHFGEEAAAALGVDPLRIFKTLVVDSSTGPRPELAVAVVPVAAHLDLKAMAAALGVKKVQLADPGVAARSSGYIVGGISPLGQKTALPTIIEETAQLFDTVFVSAGRRGLQVELSPAELARLTRASFADIAG